MKIHNLSWLNKIRNRRQYMRLKFPYAYSISLGEWKCNRICRMCPMFNAPPKVERYINDAVFNKACRIVDQRKVSIEISAYGETFQHPKADEYLFMVRKLCPNATIVVATNGSLLHRERCERIVDSGIDHLSFSLDAGSAESYQWLTRATNYDEVCHNLETLVKIRNQRQAKHLKITTHIIGIKELQHEFEPFVKRWSTVVDSALVRTYGNWAGLVDDNEVSPADRQAVPEERYPCAWLWYATKIEPNGDVSKCFVHVTGDDNPLGNIMEQSFESIWKGARLKKLREMHCRNQYKEIELCGSCIVWSLFPDFWKKKGIFASQEWK